MSIMLNYWELMNLKKACSKDELKEHLRYVVIETSRQRLCATNGHVLFIVDQQLVDSSVWQEANFLDDEIKDKQLFIDLSDVEIGKTQVCLIHRNRDTNLVIVAIWDSSLKKCVKEYIKRENIGLFQFPEVDRVIPDRNSRVEISSIRINTELLPISDGLRFIFTGVENPILIDVYYKKPRAKDVVKLDNSVCVLMPMRGI